jgi:RRXRR protein
MVFVLDKHKKPLMPCTPKKARLLLSRGRAVVHRRYPLVIRLKDRRLEESVVQPLVLKIDPGSKTSGMAVARVEATPRGEVHYAVHLAEIGHRGEQVHAAMGTRARARRRRRSAHLRYRPPHTPQGVVAPIAALADRQCADLGTAVQAVGTPHPLGGGTGQI